MAQKITLSIPDMLHEKLTQWRSSFNFSKLFQEALTEAIQKKRPYRSGFQMSLICLKLSSDCGKKKRHGKINSTEPESARG